MKNICLLLSLCIFISTAEDGYMVIYRKDNNPIIVKVNEIEKVVFNPEDFNCLVLYNAYQLFRGYYNAQSAYEAETNKFASLKELEDARMFRLPTEDKYFTFYEVDKGILEASAKATIKDIAQNSIFGISIINHSFSLYTKNGLDSSVINKCYSNTR